VLNNAATHHFQKLVHHVMAILEKLERQQQPSQQAVNAVYFLRLIVKHLTENLSAAQLVDFVNGESHANGSAGSNAFAAAAGAVECALLHWTVLMHACNALPVATYCQSTGNSPCSLIFLQCNTSGCLDQELTCKVPFMFLF